MNATHHGLERRTLGRPNCELSYRVRPSQSGRWVVFLHGAGMDGHMFEAQLSAVPVEIGIVCWDARGHGASALHGPFRYLEMCADLEALVDTWGAESVDVVGQSMGGNLAQTFLDRNPAKVNKMALIDCTANHGQLSRMDKAALLSTRIILSLYPWKIAVRQSAQACGVLPETVRYAQRCLERIGKERFVEVMSFWSEALDPDLSYSLNVPTLAVVGDRDRSGNIQAAMTRLAQMDANTRLVTLSPAAHNSNMDQPEETNRELRSFLDW